MELKRYPIILITLIIHFLPAYSQSYIVFLYRTYPIDCNQFEHPVNASNGFFYTQCAVKQSFEQAIQVPLYYHTRSNSYTSPEPPYTYAIINKGVKDSIIRINKPGDTRLISADSLYKTGPQIFIDGKRQFLYGFDAWVIGDSSVFFEVRDVSYPPFDYFLGMIKNSLAKPSKIIFTSLYYKRPDDKGPVRKLPSYTIGFEIECDLQ